MRSLLSAARWAIAILLVALGARTGWVGRSTTDLLLMVLPMIAFVTFLDGRSCRPAMRGA